VAVGYVCVMGCYECVGLVKCVNRSNRVAFGLYVLMVCLELASCYCIVCICMRGGEGGQVCKGWSKRSNRVAF